ncbi:MAG: T9SS type A sorting domain-containing protein [Bacteroidetes bacterium]|nr:T9SS type A sorting domain-containing protein [Bacteroidota bacterium]
MINHINTSHNVTHDGLAPKTNEEKNAVCLEIRNHALVFCIRAVAGLLWYIHSKPNPSSNPPRPVISSVIQSPSYTKAPGTGRLYCNLQPSQCGGSNTFYWEHSGEPNGTTFSQGDNWLEFTIPPKQSKDVSKVFYYNVRVQNSVTGYSYWYGLHKVNWGYDDIGGCPWIVVQLQDSSFNYDNNLLDKSLFPQFSGQFISDRYLLNPKPGIFDGKIKLTLLETGQDSTVYNSIKLYSLSHPSGTKVGITENNDIVIFDSANVIQTKNAIMFDSLYNGSNITSQIQFHNQYRGIPPTGDTLYHIYSEYKPISLGTPGIILYSGGIINPINPVVKDNYSGHYYANTQSGLVEGNFVRRENSSLLVIPLSNGSRTNISVDSIHLKWNKDFKITYAAITNLTYVNTELSLLTLDSAFHSLEGNVTLNLNTNDSSYTYTSQNSYIDLVFSNNSVYRPTSITDYIIEVNGKIISVASNIKYSTDKQMLDFSKSHLNENFPNPFNPITKIGYTINKPSIVKLKIYDITGREVKVLVNEFKNSGDYIVEFNGSNLASGVYFYRIESGDFTDVKRMILIK